MFFANESSAAAAECSVPDAKSGGEVEGWRGALLLRLWAGWPLQFFYCFLKPCIDVLCDTPPPQPYTHVFTFHNVCNNSVVMLRLKKRRGKGNRNLILHMVSQSSLLRKQKPFAPYLFADSGIYCARAPIHSPQNAEALPIVGVLLEKITNSIS